MQEDVMNVGIIRDTEFTNEPRGMNVAMALKNHGYNVFVLCYGQEKKIEYYKGILLDRFYLNKSIRKKIYPLIETLPIYKYLWICKIRNFIAKYKIEILHVHDLYMIGAAINANKEFHLPLILDFHENYVAAIKTYNWANNSIGKLLVKPNRWAFIEQKSLRHVNKLLVMSQEFKNVLLDKYSYLSEKDIVVYRNVPNIDEFSSYKIDDRVFTPKNELVLFYFGVIGERRGIFDCFNAIRILIREGIDILLLMIGPVDHSIESRFQTYMNDPQISSHVLHYAWKNINEIPSYLSKSHICLSPLLKNEHHDTTIANKIFQYMLYEKPVIVSDCKPQKRIVEKEKCGLVFKAGSPDDLADKIFFMYSNQELMKTMGKRGKKAVLREYNLTKEMKTIINMYNDIGSSVSK